MRKALFVLTTLCLFGTPALAQQSATGQSSSGPARVGAPGQVTAPQGGSGMMATQGGGQTMVRSSRSKKMMRAKCGKRAIMRSRRGRM